jgi:hypothetical protein
MKRFVITNTILSRAEGAAPADVTWYRGENPVQALAALAQAFAHGEDSEESSLPESMKYDVIAVRMDMHVVADCTCQDPEKAGGNKADGSHWVPCPEHDASPSIPEDVMLQREPAPGFDSETTDYALSDCAWWDEPQANRPWWAKADCSGPRIGDTAHGVLCEGHFNAIPKGDK